MMYKANWEDTKQKWTNWWNHCNTGRPLMYVLARKPGVGHPIREKEVDYGGTTGVMCQGNYYDMPEELKCVDIEDQYMNAERMVERYRFFCQQHEFLGESFPNMSADFGPGSLAAYLGCDLNFSEDTVWTKPCWEELEEWEGMKFDPENPWFKKHLKLVQDCAKLVGDDFLVAMPDLMENMDVLASMRGTMDLLTDILTEPEILEDCLTRLDELYYEYYDRCYDAIVQEGGNAYTVFQVWGPGKTTKVQCDLSSMFSTDSFRQFVVPYLRSQAKKADNVLFHLDGPDMIRHLDAVLEIDEIDVIQWVSGKTNPDGTFPQWDEIYEKTLRAGKSIFVYVDSGEFEDWIRNADRIVKKFGSHSLYLHFPEMSYDQAQYLLDYAEKNWSDVKGSFFE